MPLCEVVCAQHGEVHYSGAFYLPMLTRFPACRSDCLRNSHGLKRVALRAGASVLDGPSTPRCGECRIRLSKMKRRLKLDKLRLCPADGHDGFLA